jgi:predicted  nucleic acid-binding Zn-ribbon protein
VSQEGAWRARFGALRNEKTALEEGLVGKRERLAELRRQRTLFHKTSDRIEYNKLEESIRLDEQRINEIERSLADLDLEASKAAVPLEWRK